MDAEQALRWLSEPRLRPFLDAQAGDLARAVELHAWHARLSVEVFGLVQAFEILLRNAVDGTLGADQPQTPLRDTWVLDFDVLQPNGVKQVITAVERLERGRAVTRSRVVAGLSFGFWAGLFGNRYEELWRHSLRYAFPHGRLQRKDMSRRLDAVRRLRNRVAHHDSLLGQPVGEIAESIVRIAGWIDPAAAVWLGAHEQVTSVLARRPRSP